MKVNINKNGNCFNFFFRVSNAIQDISSVANLGFEHANLKLEVTLPLIFNKVKRCVNPLLKYLSFFLKT